MNLSTHTLTEADIESYFGFAAAHNGSKHQRLNQVSQEKINFETSTVTGVVEHSKTDKYGVKVVLLKGMTAIRNSICTCSAGGRCQHAAALLFHIIRTQQLYCATTNSSSAQIDEKPITPTKEGTEAIDRAILQAKSLGRPQPQESSAKQVKEEKESQNQIQSQNHNQSLSLGHGHYTTVEEIGPSNYETENAPEQNRQKKERTSPDIGARESIVETTPSPDSETKRSTEQPIASLETGAIENIELTPVSSSWNNQQHSNALNNEPEVSPADYSIDSWLNSIDTAINEDAKEAQVDPSNTGAIAYTLTPRNRINKLSLNLYLKKYDPSTCAFTNTKLELSQVLFDKTGYVSQEDNEILKLFRPDWRSRATYHNDELPEIPDISRLLLEKLLASGRCCWKSVENAPLSLGQAKKASLEWITESDGNQVLKVMSVDAGDLTVIAGGAWYLDERKKELGPLELPVSQRILNVILTTPPLAPRQAEVVAKALRRAEGIIPLPKTSLNTQTIIVEPTGLLTLTMQNNSQETLAKTHYSHCKSKIIARASFSYDGAQFPPGASEYHTVEGDKITIYRKPLYGETRLIDNLTRHGLRKMELGKTAVGTSIYGFPRGSDIDWLKFTRGDAKTDLQSKGWQIKYGNESENNSTFKQLEVLEAQEQWSVETDEVEGFWLPVQLAIKVNGKKVSLLPIINQAIGNLSGKDPLADLERLNVSGKFYAPLPTGGYVALPFERVKDMITALMELFAQNHIRETGEIELSLPELEKLTPVLERITYDNTRWKISDKLTGLMEKIKTFKGLAPVKPPRSFKAKLRDYQLEGLTWLNFLREFELGGILADDMGLGKTVQTLAHIAIEKNARRLNKPVLVVCPTSVLPNWLSEIEKFTPNLKALALWGKERSDNFAQIDKADIVVTTYALVTRDCEILKKQYWKAVVLDEAQYVKNPTTQAAQAVRRLKSDYRLCLTGTPIENHLGELWSQFHFILPGYLKDQTNFSNNYRTPIEKHNNAERQKQLTKKIKPFLLRRSKELVAGELPEKTTMIKKVELSEAQRDLYETVRMAMYEKIRDALTSKGLAKSQILILDAMLKLRQVCCDPRLVAIPSAKNVHSSAKLDLLLEMLEELLEEGKRVLLFSQFTSMLDLIIPELEKREIDFVEIRGSTADRATPVRRFQNQEVPLFLLSLKAGGTGLNLTEADTVIHYDPWWNPAVEAQATDRAHRIGQTQTVFVFKLIAAGTIEERLLHLQVRKKDIADGIYGDIDTLPSKLTAEDLETLFRPLD
jgi:superfamily II DNA or RNA helicase